MKQHGKKKSESLFWLVAKCITDRAFLDIYDSVGYKAGAKRAIFNRTHRNIQVMAKFAAQGSGKAMKEIRWDSLRHAGKYAFTAQEIESLQITKAAIEEQYKNLFMIF